MINQYDIFMKALKEVRPDLAELCEFISNDLDKSDNKVKTFEDCSRVEKEIIDSLNKAYYNMGERSSQTTL